MIRTPSISSARLSRTIARTRAKRDLQLEARAHIAVQKWIDEGGLKDRAVTADGLRETHGRFCELLPEELLFVEDPHTNERLRVVPGELRRRDVEVGRHLAISPGAVPRFLERFEHVYGDLGNDRCDPRGGGGASPAALDSPVPGWQRPRRAADVPRDAARPSGYRRRLVGRAGLARSADKYKQLLANCDQPRRNDLDGRGTLSEEALAEFTRFFLQICIDQVTFMEGLMQPNRFRARIQLWAEEEIRLGALPRRSGAILEAALYRGELPRGEAAQSWAGANATRGASSSALIEPGHCYRKVPARRCVLAFPAALAQRWMPGLFPEQA